MEQAKYDLVAELEKIKDDRQNSICQYIPVAQAFRTLTFPVTGENNGFTPDKWYEFEAC